MSASPLSIATEDNGAVARAARNRESGKRVSSHFDVKLTDEFNFRQDATMNIRHLLSRPFLNYANFSGRSARPEFWLFVLTFTAITQGSALIGYGIANLVTPPRRTSHPIISLKVTGSGITVMTMIHASLS